MRVGDQFFETYGLPFSAGRAFSSTIPSDATEAFILNETAVRAFGWETPEEAIGQPFAFQEGRNGHIVGVVKDFHFSSLRFHVQPVVMYVGDSTGFPYISIKTTPAGLSNAMDAIEQTWKTLLPTEPYRTYVLSDIIQAFYLPEMMLGNLMGALSIIALFIACLGLFGLAAFTVEQRTKEIGIRKALGASVSSVVLGLSKEFLKLVCIANLIAWPMAYALMLQALNLFIYRTDIRSTDFIGTCALTLTIALATVGYHALKAATAKPVDALRHE